MFFYAIYLEANPDIFFTYKDNKLTKTQRGILKPQKKAYNHHTQNYFDLYLGHKETNRYDLLYRIKAKNNLHNNHTEIKNLLLSITEKFPLTGLKYHTEFTINSIHYEFYFSCINSQVNKNALYWLFALYDTQKYFDLLENFAISSQKNTITYYRYNHIIDHQEIIHIKKFYRFLNEFIFAIHENNITEHEKINHLKKTQKDIFYNIKPKTMQNMILAWFLFAKNSHKIQTFLLEYPYTTHRTQ